MGDFRITIDAVGGHGCQREIKDGGVLSDCSTTNCPDCAARKFVAEFARHNNVLAAKLEHWPVNMLRHDGTYVQREDGIGPVDNLLTGVRSGSF